ncbi:MAG: hypothetical protein UU73_C0002G0064 [Candidatus Daviesbacteria bacterium GW2011_GWA1_41_61]|nr:MAG: hypothetical protein UU26_C0015G0002 [Candidatus Daviesbacteria bacterium GW2011_GWC1_40_9]KKR93724.1 MAG: hypothetical protein UU44_C0001G0064 [Candidatus Daviesbacteria bacterium GW2011_GWB1_41_15]KKS15190.1 MAG: hypothetical protein UU73_C0002G0064 [Candidatus Daviesbacteria bacterium GW2011_GWA1_41_61]
MVSIFVANGGFKNLFRSSTVRAFGELLVDFHLPPSEPIFVVNNWAPGGVENRSVDVQNGGSQSYLVAVKAIKKGGVGADLKIETILGIIIKEGLVPVYGDGSPTGSKSVTDFFGDSAGFDGVVLGTINPASTKTYNFEVTFPISAGNEFQGKTVIFDLSFGTVTEYEGTIGFWRNWNKHQIYLQSDINSWLEAIDDTSWFTPFAPLTTTKMVQIIDDATKNCNNSKKSGDQLRCAKNKFSAQYLVTQLNVKSGRKNLAKSYNLSFSLQSILGGGSVQTLGQLFSRTDSKAPALVNRQQYLDLASLYDVINNQGI